MDTTTKQPKTRYPRTQGGKIDNPYSMDYIEKGWEAMRMLNLFGSLTSWQVCKLLFLGTPNSHGVPRKEVAARAATNRYCLIRLKQLGYVKVKPIGMPDKSPAQWEMNYLTPTGYRALSEYRMGQNLATFPYRGVDDITYTNVTYHSMAIKDAMVSMIAGALRYGMEPVICLDDVAIRSGRKRGKIKWPMEPDYLIVLKYGENKYGFFGEADMGTESIESDADNSWRTKMKKYKLFFHDYWKSDPLVGSLSQIDVMTSTTVDERLLNLSRCTASVGGRSGYWFTTHNLLQPPYSFFGRVWQRVGATGYHSPAERFTS